ncbi:unnamed protein product [Dovyalis caffra]|uniref:Heat shock protein 70 n=1 Tax=Dovyalis caffra TaxID=77055 RepID=A0AAV1QQW4_9ROSI|nr:unnamed protein product [Dovyalis caffra]
MSVVGFDIGNENCVIAVVKQRGVDVLLNDESKRETLAVNFKDPEVQNELKMLPFETSEGKDGGILIHLKYLGETHTFTPVQILAMLFSDLKDIAEKNFEIHVTDRVIGVPSYFTDLQRRAYLDAATIAGLKPLRLMHDCAAISRSYQWLAKGFLISAFGFGMLEENGEILVTHKSTTDPSSKWEIEKFGEDAGLTDILHPMCF